ncbi:hypothetical protein C8J56DRAFT_63650 [Mycena floridula]|nr:hypothetical protein C8J56DRAFT_63650 [Mycena floridula]
MILPRRLISLSSLYKYRAFSHIPIQWQHTPSARLSVEPSLGVTPAKKALEHPPRSSAQISEDELAATQLEQAMESKEALQRALDLLTPRVREAFELVAFTQLSVDEICEKMRPGKPMSSQTIANYVLKAFERADMGFDEEAALFRAIGKERITEFVRSADPFRWRKSNGFDSYITNSAKVTGLCKSEKKRAKLVEDVRKGLVRGEEIEKQKFGIVWGWTPDTAPTLPRHIAAQIVSTEIARRKGLSTEQRIALRDILKRRKDFKGISFSEGLDSITERVEKELQSETKSHSDGLDWTVLGQLVRKNMHSELWAKHGATDAETDREGVEVEQEQEQEEKEKDI